MFIFLIAYVGGKEGGIGKIGLWLFIIDKNKVKDDLECLKYDFIVLICYRI